MKHQLRKLATHETLDYVKQNMMNCISLENNDKKTLFDYILPKINQNGLILEFGVHKGYSISYIAKKIGGRIIHGFDSFEGLPEDWIGQFPKAHFSLNGQLPQVPPNVQLHKGWFTETLKEFKKTNNEKISFMHIDCDLYSSTKIIFDLLGDQISENCIIIFDEYFNFPNWQEHEFRAFQEYVKSNKINYKYLAFTNRQQVAVQIT